MIIHIEKLQKFLLYTDFLSIFKTVNTVTGVFILVGTLSKRFFEVSSGIEIDRRP